MSVNVYKKTEDKLIPIAGATVYADNPIGSIIPYGGSQLPAGWFICDGRSLSKNDYFDLWKVIGYNFGGSNSTFNLPDLRNRAVMGAGTTGVLGASQLAQLPNITGKIDNKSGTFGIMGFSSGTGSFSGALKGSEAKGAVYTGQQNTSACKVVTFDASYSGASTDINGNNVYTNNGETRPANVRLNFIIKAKHTPVPADFMDAIQSMNDWKSIWTGNVHVPSTDGIQNTLVSGLSLSGYRQVCLILDSTNGHRNPSRIIIDNVYGYGDSYGSYRRSSLYGSCWGFEAFFSDGRVTGEYTVEGWTTFSVNLVQILAR